ncbi:MAG: hypothetical protein DCF25_08955 [Leptolyngbya foveolarum]|uniref:Uncharacterized protein n=1 Tax=Leptolyngbya foveolarum TaxID=47253 RepID=A0A2W4UPX9_9CYAN|nr:MAG: hypothetical protein DCF25_08955 [Leptolyngbya foveolarum]
MTISPLAYDVVVSAPDPLPTDLIEARYDAKTNEIVVMFGDSKVARIPVGEFEELAVATAVDYESLDGTRAGVTCITEAVDFAVSADWWRSQAT